MRKAIATIWYAIAAMATVVHIATFLGIDLVTLAPPVWGLHAAAMISGASTLISGGFKRSWSSRSSVLDMLDGPRLEPNDPANDEELRRRMRPSRLKLAIQCLGAYALVNMIACLAMLQGDSALRGPGAHRPGLEGPRSAALAEAHHQASALLQTRAFSGFWMLALFVAASVWWASGRPRAASK